MRVLIAPDKFAGTLSAVEAAAAIAEGWRRTAPHDVIVQVPLADGSVDLAILSQALHHARHPQKAVDEAWRILRPGGQLLVLDLNEHTFTKARELYADRWLGFKESALHGFLRKAGFAKVEVTMVAREPVEPHFETLLACGFRDGPA